MKTLPAQTKRDRGNVEWKDALGLPKFYGKEAGQENDSVMKMGIHLIEQQG